MSMTFTSFSSALISFFGPGFSPMTRTSVTPEIAKVTFPPNCSIRALTLSLPILSPVPPPRSGQMPEMTNLNPSRLSWTMPSRAVGVIALSFLHLPHLLGVVGCVLVGAVKVIPDISANSFRSGGALSCRGSHTTVPSP